jgi:ABC-type dipeptide/oligopeptide/nickel transport system permease component
MAAYIRDRLLQTFLTLVIMSMVVFGLARVSGDPTYLLVNQNAPLEDVIRIRHVYGLDQPLPVQYGIYMWNLLHGDLGTSLRTRLPVAQEMAERLPSTLQLAFITVVFSALVGLPLGALAAVKRGTVLDRVLLGIAAVCQSIPAFWIAIVGVLIFSVGLGWLPVAGSGGPSHYVLPVACVSLNIIAWLFRLERSNMIEVLALDYVSYARVKGLSEVAVVLRHALPNAIIPVMTVLGIVLSTLISGLIVVETVFAWPGMGTLAQEAIAWRDYPLMQGWMLTILFFVAIINMIVDILYGLVDPRLRPGTR